MKLIKFLWNKWLSVARPIGNFQSQVILSVFYLIILIPLGILFKLFLNPFTLKSKNSSFSKWIYPKQDLSGAKKPF